MEAFSSGVCSSSFLVLSIVRSLCEGNKKPLYALVLDILLELVGDGGLEMLSGLSSAFMLRRSLLFKLPEAGI